MHTRSGLEPLKRRPPPSGGNSKAIGHGEQQSLDATIRREIWCQNFSPWKNDHGSPTFSQTTGRWRLGDHGSNGTPDATLQEMGNQESFDGQPGCWSTEFEGTLSGTEGGSRVRFLPACRFLRKRGPTC